jgi:hypothetical protein
MPASFDGEKDRTMPRRYAKSAGKDVKREMHKMKRGKLKSGKGGKGGTVKSRKQAIAIGLSEARKKGKKVPAKRRASKTVKHPSKTSKRRTSKKAAESVVRAIFFVSTNPPKHARQKT